MIAFRLFDPGDDGSPRSNYATLSTIFEGHFLPVRLATQSEKTRALYRDSVTWWRKLTGDPPLDQITPATTAEFVRALLEQPGRAGAKLSPATARKHAKNINAVFRFTGPRAWRMEDCLGLVDVPPRVREPARVEEPVEHDWTAGEVGELLAAIGSPPAPALEGLDPARWWRALIVAAYFTGLRRGTLLALEWGMLTGDGWAVIPARCFKGKRRGRRVFLHPAVVEELDAIRGAAAGPVFPWPHCLRYFSTRFDAIVARAFEERRRFCFHALRSTHLTILRRTAAGLRLGTDLAQASAGHSSPAITEGHYLNTGDGDALLAQAILAFPDPRPGREAFRGDSSPRPH